MRVTRLEIFGFKSFVDRFVLNFDKPLIGIIGPNGSGKSNIVDALRWVLGESHAKQLRGNVFDDLIFNGSETMRPLGMAEVSITIRPDEGWAKKINVVDERDMEDRLLNEKFSDEEKEKHTQEQEEDSAVYDPEKALLSIPGILNASEIQLTRRLYRSGESEFFINRVPCRLRDMTELYRIIGLGSRGLSIVQQGQISEIIGKKPIELRELLEEAAGISGFRTRVASAERQLDRTADNISRLNDLVIEVDKNVKNLRRQSKKAQLRKELKEELYHKELLLFQAKKNKILTSKTSSAADLQQLSESLQKERTRLLSHEAEIENVKSELEKLEVKLAELRESREEILSALNQRKMIEQEQLIKLQTIEEKIAAAEQRAQRLTVRKENVQRDIVSAKANLEELAQKLVGATQARTSAETFLQTLQQSNSRELAEVGETQKTQEEQILENLQEEVSHLPELTREISEVESKKSLMTRELNSLQESLNASTLKLTAAKTEIASLQKQSESMAEQLMTFGEKKDEGGEFVGGDAQILSSALRVPKELERAVAAILGEKANFLVTSSEHEIARKYASYKTETRSVKKFGVINSSALKSIPELQVPAELKTAFQAVPLLQQIECAEALREVSREVLGKVVLLPNLEEALRFKEAVSVSHGALWSQGLIIVTSEGEVVTRWGWFTTDGKGVSFSFGRRIKELQSELEVFEVEIQRVGEEIEAKAMQHEETSAVLSSKQAARELLISKQRELSELLKEAREEVIKKQKDLLSREREAQAEVRFHATNVANIEGLINAEENKIASFESEIAQLSSELEALQKEKEENETLKQELSAKFAETLRTLESSSGIAAELEQELSAQQEDIKRTDDLRNACRHQLSELSSSVFEARKLIEKLAEEEGSVKLRLDRSDIEIELLEEEFKRHYQQFSLIPEKGEWSEEGDIAAIVETLQNEVDSIRLRLEREGEVDPLVIEQCEQEEIRLNELTAQLDDLEMASKTLQRTIRELKEISRRRFLETYQFVSKKFVELVPLLFGGGGGTLELDSQEDPLNSGVRLAVRPPGKRFRAMELLSGGEKALVAASLLVSMFLYRPSPLCVLDEVDAPLDDANLDRFLSVIKDIAKSTQFLVITHNKLTMAEVDRLIGITMQEAGVSKALSVTIEEAERTLDEAVNA